MTTLTASVGTFTLTGQVVSPRMVGEMGLFALAGQDIGISREYSVTLGSLTLRLERLAAVLPIVDSQGRPSPQFQRFWQKHCEAIESSFGKLALAVQAIQTAYDAAAQATAAASEASSAATVAQSAATNANQAIDDLQNGSLNLEAITVGGKKFYNNGGVLGAML